MVVDDVKFLLSFVKALKPDDASPPRNCQLKSGVSEGMFTYEIECRDELPNAELLRRIESITEEVLRYYSLLRLVTSKLSKNFIESL
ncbi:MAG: hypothetical protein B7O98_03450 [Zestosphaera tikiterensis]|uniref:Uncharacterized protein n=1 Tax=Zestosphaera tikiterensis TaxID=1973259 RepID=A0A2R7Y7H2_9CREN|nr:MAG: hypothetical protein B7O98_03450 [Zestosphaera tikiterensis]